jgi:hypothetical protein
MALEIFKDAVRTGVPITGDVVAWGDRAPRDPPPPPPPLDVGVPKDLTGISRREPVGVAGKDDPPADEGYPPPPFDSGFPKPCVWIGMRATRDRVEDVTDDAALGKGGRGAVVDRELALPLSLSTAVRELVVFRERLECFDDLELSSCLACLRDRLDS